MDQQEVENALRALSGYVWDSSYDQFIKDMGLRDDAYAQGLFRAMGEIVRSMSVISAEIIARIIVLETSRLPQRQQSTLSMNNTASSDDVLFNELLTRLRTKKGRGVGETARKFAVAITNLETALLWFKEASKK